MGDFLASIAAGDFVATRAGALKLGVLAVKVLCSAMPMFHGFAFLPAAFFPVTVCPLANAVLPIAR